MLDTLKGLVPRDKDLPGEGERAWRLNYLEEFRTDAIYDRLPHEFHEESKEGQGDEYIPLCQRRPSVRYGLPTIIVNDSVSLLFSEGHFPAIEALMIRAGAEDKKDEKLGEMFAMLCKAAHLPDVFLEGAMRGSVGSVAFRLRILKSKPYVDWLATTYLTPTWDEEAPDLLKLVEEKYKIRGKALIAAGYTIDEKDAERDFWFVRQWTRTEEAWYLPWPVHITDAEKAEKKYPAPMTRDPERSVTHGLGFVPLFWVKNLPGGKNKIDGASTFEGALGTSIEIDYQLSQAGRGLKYSSDPTLVLKEAGITMGESSEPVVKGGSKAIRIGPQDDAFNLEISGAAVAAVENYVRMLREFALERCGGNRATPEKMSTAQSGRAMEMMNQELIRLADKLRTSYGEGALLDVLYMVLAANAAYELKIGDETYVKGSLPKPEAVKITLIWPPWYPPTASDDAQDAAAVSAYRDAGVLSRETAVRHIAPRFDIEDAAAEVKRIEDEAKAQADMESENAIKLAKETAAVRPQPVKAAA